LDNYAGYAPQELSLPEESVTYFVGESVRRVPDVDGLRRFDETFSYAELDDFADRFATLPASRGAEKDVRVAVYAQYNAQYNPQFLIAWGPRVLHRAVQVQGGIASLTIPRSPTSGLSPAPWAPPTMR
jgi:hypothetical protein